MTRNTGRTGQVEKVNRLFAGSWNKMWLKLFTVIFCKVFEQGGGRKDSNVVTQHFERHFILK